MDDKQRFRKDYEYEADVPKPRNPLVVVGSGIIFILLLGVSFIVLPAGHKITVWRRRRNKHLFEPQSRSSVHRRPQLRG